MLQLNDTPILISVDTFCKYFSPDFTDKNFAQRYNVQ